jgi:hypothetical protein
LSTSASVEVMIQEEQESDSENPQEVFKGVTSVKCECDEVSHSRLTDQAYPKVLQAASKSSPSTNLARYSRFSSKAFLVAFLAPLRSPVRHLYRPVSYW